MIVFMPDYHQHYMYLHLKGACIQEHDIIDMHDKVPNTASNFPSLIPIYSNAAGLAA